MTPVRTIVVSGIRAHRDALAALLGREEEIEIAATAPDAGGVAGRHADVVLVDTATCGAFGELATAVPAAAVLAVGVPDDEAAILRCLEDGAVAYATREATVGDVAAAVVRLGRGEVLCSPRMLRRLAVRAGVGGNGCDERLTQREHEVLELIGAGLSNKQIAGRLSIELSTVKNHVHNILEKLDVRRRNDAVARVRAARI